MATRKTIIQNEKKLIRIWFTLKLEVALAFWRALRAERPPFLMRAVAIFRPELCQDFLRQLMANENGRSGQRNEPEHDFIYLFDRALKLK
jgi:hypothetical protein